MTDKVDASVQTGSSWDLDQDEADAFRLSPLVFQLVTTKPKPSDEISPECVVAHPDTQVPTPQKVVRRVVPAIEEDIYGMDYPERGVCLILEHNEFRPQLQLSDRKGSEVDCKSASALFTRMGFQVNVQKNLPFVEISKLLKRIAAMDHARFDCLAVVVLSHGTEGILYAFDSAYGTQKLWEPFTADKAPTLAGKPKLFFLQACQGNLMDEGIKVTKASRNETDSFSSYKMPIHTDFLISHSTITGYFSWRNTVQGSWFIQSLVKVLNHCREHRDLLSMLTLANRMVSVEYESNSTRPDFNDKKQTPFLYSTLTYKVYLGPKRVPKT